jgi:hypothetical protein
LRIVWTPLQHDTRSADGIDASHQRASSPLTSLARRVVVHLACTIVMSLRLDPLDAHSCRDAHRYVRVVMFVAHLRVVALLVLIVNVISHACGGYPEPSSTFACVATAVPSHASTWQPRFTPTIVAHHGQRVALTTQTSAVPRA